MATISNKRTIADITNAGINVTLKGEVVLNSTGSIETIKGDILRSSDTSQYIGNFSELGINVQERAFTNYRTEASTLLDQVISEIENKTIVEE